MLSILILIFLLFPKIPDSNQNIEKKVYIAKIAWHVGILMEIDSLVLLNLPELSDFSNFNYVDVGWGDEDFYQSGDEFDLYLAAKAIFVPTKSVIRIQGYTDTIDKITDRRDFVIELNLDNNQFSNFCNFIRKSFARSDSNTIILSDERFGGIINFYKSIQKYHIAYTCNTWVADAVESAGLNVEPDNVITADELFLELVKVGIILNSIY